MSLLMELLGAITNVVLGAESQAQRTSLTRASDLGPFLERFEIDTRDHGVERCGEDAFCFGQAVLVCQVHPMITRDRTRLSEAALAQLEENGVSITRLTRPRPSVLSFAGSFRGGVMQGRVIPARGWVFLISGEEWNENETLGRLLDLAIDATEG